MRGRKVPRAARSRSWGAVGGTAHGKFLSHRSRAKDEDVLVLCVLRFATSLERRRSPQPVEGRVKGTHSRSRAIAVPELIRAIRRCGHMNFTASATPWTTVWTCVGLTLFAASRADATDPPGDAAAFGPPSQQEYWAQVEREDWSAAIVAAQALVDKARREAKADPLALVQALSLLGTAQLRNSDPAGAQASFAEALELAERHEGAASRHTLEPLRGLGFALAAGGDHERALPYLDRALVISHRTHGLFYVGQQSILQQLVRSLTLIGQALVAERHVNYMIKVGERSYGEDDPRMIALMTTAGDWHTEVGNFDDARRLYRDSIRLAETKLGANDLAVVKPLRRLARTFTYELEFEARGYLNPHDAAEAAQQGSIGPRRPRNPRYIDLEGQRALERAVSIVKANPNSPPQVTIETLVDAGDWFQFKEDFKKALPYYEQAAQAYLAAADQEGVQNPLAFPVRVYSPVPSPIVRGNKLPLYESQEVFVQLEFTVTAQGRVKDARIVDSNVHSRPAAEILSAIRDARFRPRFENGEPVDTVSMSFREVFRARKRSDRNNEEEPS